MAHHGWIGVDFDGTMAYYETGKFNPAHVGEPIPAMIERVRKWVDDGKTVKIFTARVAREPEASQAREVITEFLVRQGLPPLEITCVKDWNMIRLYDDRAVGVVCNTGELIGGEYAE